MCVCVSTAPGVCVCVCPLLQVCVCECVCVCALGWVKCRKHVSLYTLYNCVCDKKKISVIGFFQNRYPIMVKCLNIGKNIGKPIYRSISNFSI